MGSEINPVYAPEVAAVDAAHMFFLVRQSSAAAQSQDQVEHAAALDLVLGGCFVIVSAWGDHEHARGCKLIYWGLAHRGRRPGGVRVSLHKQINRFGNCVLIYTTEKKRREEKRVNPCARSP